MGRAKITKSAFVSISDDSRGLKAFRERTARLASRRRWLRPLLVTILCAAIAISLNLGQQAGEQKFLEIRLRINVLDGIQLTNELRDQLKQIVDKANDILKQAGVRLVMDKDTDIGRAPAIGNGDSELATEAELREAQAQGKKEVKDILKGKGIKVHLTDKIFHPDPRAIANAVSTHRDKNPGPVDPWLAFKLNAQIPTVGGRGNDLAHEIAHVLTLGGGHTIEGIPSAHLRDADPVGHDLQDPNNLMYPANPVDPNQKPRGSTLTPWQDDELKKGGGELSKLVKRSPGGFVTSVNNPLGYWSDATGDVLDPAIDLLAGSFFAEEGATNLRIALEFAASHPEDANFAIEIDSVFDTDNNLSTGVVAGSFQGIDKIVRVHLDGAFPFQPPTGQLTADVFDPLHNTTTTLAAGGVGRMSAFLEVDPNTGAPTVMTLQDGFEQDLPLSALGALASHVPVAIRCRNLDTGETDEAATILDLVPSAQPVLSLSSFASVPGGLLGVTGTGFTPNASVKILLDNTVLAQLSSSAAGSFTASLTLPQVVAGDYFVTAMDSASQFDFSVLAVQALPSGGGGSGMPRSIPTASAGALLVLVLLVSIAGCMVLVRK